jgi:hypothetical protein
VLVAVGIGVGDDVGISAGRWDCCSNFGTTRTYRSAFGVLFHFRFDFSYWETNNKYSQT